MRAFVLKRYGGPEETELCDVPQPEPGPRELLIRVHAAGLNPALKDLGRGVELAAIFWLLSLPIRLRARSRGIRYRYVFMHPSGTELAELARLIDAGKLKVTLDRAFPSDEIDDAFAYL